MKKNLSKIGYVIFAIFTMALFFLKQSKYTVNDSDIFLEELILVFVLFAGGFLLFSKKISDKIKVGILLLAIALFVSYPVYTDYLVYSHDINFHLVRIEGLAENINDLQLPARINTIVNNGYGYANPIFYPELFLAFPAFLRCFNVSFIFAFKLLLVAINILAVFLMYISVKKISKSTSSGIISAIIFAAANYRLENVFTRAAIGEALALCFFPLAIWGLYELCCGDKKKWYIFAIGISGIIQSHILSVLFAGVICATFGYVFIDKIIKEKRIKPILLSGLAIILLNSWFIWPFVDGYQLDLAVKNGGAGYVFYDYTVIPAQLFNIFDSANAYNLTATADKGMKEDMSYTLGILCTLGLIVCVYNSFKHKGEKDEMQRFLRTLTIIAVFFMILSTNIIPWKELQSESKFINNICTTIQFGWRFLGITTFAVSIGAGIILGRYVDSQKKEENDFYQNNRVIIGILILAFLAVPYFLRDFSKEDVIFTKESKLNYNLFGQIEYFIGGTDTSKLIADNYNTSSDKVKIVSYSKEKNKIDLEYISLDDNGYIEVPLLYYPGYVAKTDGGKDLEVVAGNNNVVRVNIKESGSGKIKIEYKQKVSYIIANLVSIVTVAGAIGYVIDKKIKPKKKSSCK